MKFPRFAPFLFAALLILLAEKDACAQWKNVAPGLLGPSKLFGASQYNDSTLWFGYSELWNSTDLGQSWTKINFSASPITVIRFFDKNFGVVGTHQNGVYLTQNGGLTWKQMNFSSSSIRGICYGKTRNDIAVCGDNNVLLISKDGGDNWAVTTNIQGDNWGHDIFFDQSNRLVLLASLMSPPAVSHIYLSSDFGVTWQQETGIIDYDAFSITHDSCNTGNIYILAENNAYTIDKISKILVSTNNGNSWVDPIPKPASYFSGSIESGTYSIYAPTLMNGIYRSTNFGISWKSIGGPNMHYDSRFLAVVNDNTIFACGDDGSIWASFNSGGDSITISPNGSLGIAPKSVFDLDTLHCNDSIIHSISINRAGCNPPSILSWSVIGKDSQSYRAGNLTYDSLHITFAPKTPGDHSASLVVMLNDGILDTITLKGYNDSKPFSFSASPQSLFGKDTLYLCNPQNIEKFILHTAGCLPKIISQKINGKNANDYGIINQMGTPLSNLDSVILSFKPNDSGSRSASYEITFDDGTKITIPLQGYGIAPHPLSLATTDQSTDTIGGSINVPITINGFDHTEDVDIVLHYDKELRYHGSYSITNAPLDIPTIGLSGRSKLHISQAKPNTILGYARFDVFNDSLAKSHVTFDSVTVLTAIAPCQYILPASVTSTITPPSGCGIQTLSRFMHDSTMPQISIIPNPTNGEISISTTQNVGDVSITVYDMLGVKQSISLVTFQKSSPAKIILPVANGVYNVRVRSAERTFDLRVVVNK